MIADTAAEQRPPASPTSPTSPAARDAAPARIGFFVVDGFPIAPLALGLEVLRHADLVLGRRAHEPVLISAAGGRIASSCGIAVDTVACDTARGLAESFVVYGFDARPRIEADSIAALRRLARRCPVLGGVSGGAYLLAAAGLLAGRACTIHWANRGCLAEDWPTALLSDRLFVNDPRHPTAAGGAATADLLLRRLEPMLGAAGVRQVADRLLIERPRREEDRFSGSLATAAEATAPALSRAIAMMEARIEDPCSVAEICAAVGVSRRQLARLFARHAGMRPADFYLSLRLDHARRLVSQGRLPMIEIAFASGFATPSHFAAAYRRRFGEPPSATRRRL